MPPPVSVTGKPEANHEQLKIEKKNYQACTLCGDAQS